MSRADGASRSPSSASWASSRSSSGGCVTMTRRSHEQPDLDLHRHRVRRRCLADRLGGARPRPGVDVVLPRLGASRRDGAQPVRAGRVRARRGAPRRRLPLVLRRAVAASGPSGPPRIPGMEAEAALDLDALGAITDAVESGRGVPEVVRAAARALDASLVLIDRSSAVLAVAARSTADERALMADAAGVATHELRVGDAVVGRLRVRGRGGEPPEALLRIVTTLIASEVERVRAPERASEAAQEAFLRAVLHREVTDRGDIVARAAELGIDVASGSALIVVRT